jgi:hypothetical protein
VGFRSDSLRIKRRHLTGESMDGEAVALLAEPVWVVTTTENSIGGVIHAGDRREAPDIYEAQLA